MRERVGERGSKFIRKVLRHSWPPADVTYGAVQPEGQQHDEEDDGPGEGAGQGSYGLRVDDEHQART